ncbi:DUF6086 family protein [Nocardioides sp. NPDC000445]|uniref:DUF6086 family protein n=1 Tax=Nocardioides sp. NPDC000445 TaxID=3154257 RepID=UPI00332C4E0F
MSFIIEINDETVWSPALDVGTAYTSCAQALGTTIGVDPGFTFIAEDYVEVDPSSFHTFATALRARVSKSRDHPVLAPLFDAVLAPTLLMLERAGYTVDLSADPELLNKVEALRTLPR